MRWRWRDFEKTEWRNTNANSRKLLSWLCIPRRRRRILLPAVVTELCMSDGGTVNWITTYPTLAQLMHVCNAAYITDAERQQHIVTTFSPTLSITLSFSSSFFMNICVPFKIHNARYVIFFSLPMFVLMFYFITKNF